MNSSAAKRVVVAVVLLGVLEASAQSPAPASATASSPPKDVPAPTLRAAASGPPEGQWVRTTQYGWLWLPYEPSYTSMAGGSAYVYAYGPALGWGWVAAPWVQGLGPDPLYGPLGAGRFSWRARPWIGAGGGWATRSRWDLGWARGVGHPGHRR
jgi:hypothetical protein